MIYGYSKKLLRINMTQEKFTAETIPDEVFLNYIGGRGLNIKYLYDEIKPGTDPFSADNKVFIAVGPLSGTFMPSSGKIEFATKSPATGGYGDSSMGGHFAAELKQAGYDMLIIEGIADSPKLLYIENNHVELRDASKYWGIGSLTAEKMIKDDLGAEYQIATIGIAGENLVKFACITHDFGRQAGRCGIGAVLGSKKLKAIAIKGDGSVPVADPDALLKFGKDMYNNIYKIPAFKEWPKVGTCGVTNWVNDNGCMPVKNFREGTFEGVKNQAGENVQNEICVKEKGCFGCPIPCGKYCKVSYKGKTVYEEGPEYEVVGLVGGNCQIEKLHEVGYLNYLMDEYGLDAISAGNIIAFALECVEKGIINKADVDGLELKYGDTDSAVYLLEKIAKREGIGDLLAEGTRTASRRLGKGSEDFAIQVKGLEVSAYEPRNAAGMLLAYMTCDIGAHHTRAWAITYDMAVGRYVVEGKAEFVAKMQNLRSLIESFCMCRFPWVELAFDVQNYHRIFNIITGMDKSWEDLLKIGEKEFNMVRAFNFLQIEDFGRKYDYPPARFYKEPLEGNGPTAGGSMSFDTVETLLDDYYAIRKWDKEGKPTREKLEELGVSNVADDLGI